MLAEVRQGESREEWEAKWAVSAFVEGTPHCRNLPRHDYDIGVGGRVIALEVTRSAPGQWTRVQEPNAHACAAAQGKFFVLEADEQAARSRNAR
jgi:hypothetical protein